VVFPAYRFFEQDLFLLHPILLTVPLMEDISYDASQLKRELNDLKGKYILLKEQLAGEFE